MTGEIIGTIITYRRFVALLISLMVLLSSPGLIISLQNFYLQVRDLIGTPIYFGRSDK